MFLSPIFYPLSAVPEPFRNFLYINPLTLIAEQVRAVLFHGLMPDWRALAIYALLAWLFAGTGYFFFMRARMGIADVI
jgi:lipopolysaccharide transport system permease protein